MVIQSNFLPCRFLAEFMKSSIHPAIILISLFFAHGFSSNLRLYGQYDGAVPVPDVWVEGFENIQPEKCREWLSLLAGPVFEGRGTGQPGYIKAAHWIAGKAAEFGLEPMGDAGTYFQMLPMSRMHVDEEQSSLSGPNDFSVHLSGAIGLTSFGSDVERSGELVVLHVPKGFRNRSAFGSLQGKFVVVVTDRETFASTSRFIARQQPAVVLRVTEDEIQSMPQLQRGPNRARPGPVTGRIRQATAIELIGKCGGSAEWLQPSNGEDLVTHETTEKLTLNIRFREEPASVPNVLAWLEGSDPELRHQYVVIGAHLDHLGRQGDGLYPGADDNGSGSTAVLAIAEALAKNPEKPKRSVLFIWFAAEEIGLVGSAHYCENPILPIEDMICMLNIDMVGRNEENANETADQNIRTLHLIGSQKGDNKLHEIILAANEHIQFEFEFDEESVFGRSDQANFHRKGISVAFLFGGFHPDYHATTDLPSKINFDKIAGAARLFYITSFLVADHGPLPVPKPESSDAR